MNWTVLVFACFTNYCVEMYWLEYFETETECNDTLPMINAQITDHNIHVIDLGCINYDQR